MCDYKSSLSKKEINAIRNVLNGTISMEHCCLSDLKQKQIILAANIFLKYSSEFNLDSDLNNLFVIMMDNKHKERDWHRIKAYYELIKDLINSGEKLNLVKFRISKVKNVIGDLKKKTVIQSMAISENVYKERYKELVLGLIKQQGKEAKAYFDSLKPYNDHVRRYSYSTENQNRTKDMFVSELKDIYGDLYDYSSVIIE